jgi:hypothetical protein
VPIIVADASGAFCHLGHRGANKRTRWNRPATPPQCRRQVQRTPGVSPPRGTRARGWSAHGGSSVRAVARPLQMKHSTPADGIPKGGSPARRGDRGLHGAGQDDRPRRRSRTHKRVASIPPWPCTARAERSNAGHPSVAPSKEAKFTLITGSHPSRRQCPSRVKPGNPLRSVPLLLCPPRTDIRQRGRHVGKGPIVLKKSFFADD